MGVVWSRKIRQHCLRGWHWMFSSEIRIFEATLDVSPLWQSICKSAGFKSQDYSDIPSHWLQTRASVSSFLISAGWTPCQSSLFGRWMVIDQPKRSAKRWDDVGCPAALAEVDNWGFQVALNQLRECAGVVDECGVFSRVIGQVRRIFTWGSNVGSSSNSSLFGDWYDWSRNGCPA